MICEIVDERGIVTRIDGSSVEEISIRVYRVVTEKWKRKNQKAVTESVNQLIQRFSSGYIPNIQLLGLWIRPAKADIREQLNREAALSVN